MNKIPLTLFIILLAVLMVYVLAPIFGLMNPSFDNIRLNLDPSAVGLAALLILMSLALVLIERIPPSSYIKSLKVSTGGIEAVFEELRQIATQIQTEETPQKVRNEIRQIRRSDREGNPTGIFLELVIEIEKKLRLLSGKPEESWKYASMPRMTERLVRNEVIDRRLSDLIRKFWDLRNRVVHGRVVITKEHLEEAISIGEVILSQLDEAYKRTSN
jgi:hypothetical protein